MFGGKEEKARRALTRVQEAFAARQEILGKARSGVDPQVARKFTEIDQKYTASLRECAQYVDTDTIRSYRQQHKDYHWVLPLDNSEIQRSTIALTRIAQDWLDSRWYEPNSIVDAKSFKSDWWRGWIDLSNRLEAEGLADSRGRLHWGLNAFVIAFLGLVKERIRRVGSPEIRRDCSRELDDQNFARLMASVTTGQHRMFMAGLPDNMWGEITGKLLSLLRAPGV
jgi:hypothetical protein